MVLVLALTETIKQNSKMLIDFIGPYVTPELSNDLQCNVGNMLEKFTLYLYALKPRDVSTSKVYLTIRLLALDFYAVIVDEGEARINYHRIEIESE